MSVENFDNWELILIDNNSTDGTLNYCINELKHYDCIKVLSSKIPSAYFSRNLGINSSRGRYLIFAEDDLIIPIDWFKKIIQCVERYHNVRVFSFKLKSLWI